MDEILGTHSRRSRILLISTGRWKRPAGRILLQRPVRAMLVVVIDVLAEDQPQMPFAGDQHPAV